MVRELVAAKVEDRANPMVRCESGTGDGRKMVEELFDDR